MKIDVPHFSQDNDWYCGPASLQMILARMGKHITQEELARIGKTTKETGTKTAIFPEIVKEVGFDCKVKTGASIDDLKNLLEENNPPMIEFVEPSNEEYHHAVVVGIEGDKIMLNDPWNGKDFTMQIADFEKRWEVRDRWILTISNDNEKTEH